MKKKIGVIGVLVAILVLGVGYAAITARFLWVNGTASMTADDNNFDVVFTGTPDPDTGATATIGKEVNGETDYHYAFIDVTGLSYAGQEINIDFNVENISHGLDASLSTPIYTITGDTTYFEVTATYDDDLLETPPEDGSTNPDSSTIMHVRVIAKKTPVDNVNCNIGIKVTANPLPVDD